MRARSLAAIAVLFGVVAAIVVALAVPTRSTGDTTPPAQNPIVVVPRRSAKPVRGQLLLVPQRGTVRIVARMSDPLGGPPFAVRVFRAERRVPNGPHPSIENSRLLGHELCAQLGRVYRGQFGWLDPRRRFRPGNFSYFDAPILCGDRWGDERSAPLVQLTTLISDPSAEAARELQSLVWGFGGRLTRGVTLTGLTDKSPALAREGVFLARAPLGARANELRARFVYARRAPQRVSFGFIAGTRRGPGHIGDRVQPIPGTAVVEARAPDPGGGLAWGVLGYRTSRGYCVTQPGRVVDDRVGTVNFVLGTFSDIWDVGRQCGASMDGLPPDWPVGVGSSFGGGLMPQSLDPTADPQTGRIARRTLRGRTVIYGVARPTVRQVTIETPRDGRTLIPSKRAHSFIVVYDGTFPTGQLKLTAKMADGSHKTVRQIAGF